jgi:OOP family OmpA-OmpF porin
MTARWTPFEIVTGATAAFLALAFACVSLEAARFETGVAVRATAALDTAGLYWFAVEPRGRAVLLTGAAADAEAAARAAAIVADVPGAGAVENRIEVIGTAGACQALVDGAQGSERVTFRKGSDEVAPAGELVIAAVAQALARCSARVEVAVHAEQGGNPMLGLRLSQRRADQVARRLARNGVPAERIVATGYGSRQPVTGSRHDTSVATEPAPAPAEPAAAAGPRVEFRILGAAT